MRAREKGGEAALKARPQHGPRPKRNTRQLARLEKLLLKAATKHGYATVSWTSKRVAELIERHFGVRHDLSGVWHLLRRMNWSSQKPESRARERDEDRA